MRYHKLTNEEKVAQKISALVSDLRVDLEAVGMYLSYIQPSVGYNRLQVVAESAKYHKEEKDVRGNHYALFD